MLRKLACVGIVMTFCLGICLADEFNAVITKIDGKNVTFHKVKFADKKFEKGEEMTMPASGKVKVAKGMFNKDTKKFEVGDEIAGGLKAEPLANIGEKGVLAHIVTDADNKKITQINIMKKGKKKQ
jgi:hypothetical protein